MSRAREYDARQVWSRAKALRSIDSPELLTLKAHVLVEGVLYRMLGRRLDIAPDRLPGIAFKDLVTLALTGHDVVEDQIPLVRRLTQLRNECAHAWEVPQLEAGIRDIVEATEDPCLEWPQGRDAQIAIYRLALMTLVAILNGAAIFDSMSPEEWEQLENRIREKATRAVARLRLVPPRVHEKS